MDVAYGAGKGGSLGENSLLVGLMHTIDRAGIFYAEERHKD
jgi:hypothetical protein